VRVACMCMLFLERTHACITCIHDQFSRTCEWVWTPGERFASCRMYAWMMWTRGCWHKCTLCGQCLHTYTCTHTLTQRAPSCGGKPWRAQWHSNQTNNCSFLRIHTCRWSQGEGCIFHEHCALVCVHTTVCCALVCEHTTVYTTVTVHFDIDTHNQNEVACIQESIFTWISAHIYICWNGKTR